MLNKLTGCPLTATVSSENEIIKTPENILLLRYKNPIIKKCYNGWDIKILNQKRRRLHSLKLLVPQIKNCLNKISKAEKSEVIEISI